jgi:ComF family protein
MELLRLAASARDAVLDLLYPPRCVGCEREGAYLCPDCTAGLPLLSEGEAVWGGGPLDGIVAPFIMSGAAREAVHRLKYSGLRAIAPLMGRMMAERLGARAVAADLVVPVPLHPRRKRQRGYNQAELLAREVSRSLMLPLDAQGLVRVGHAGQQARAAGREERRANVAGAFLARRAFSGLAVLLVDDVATTGATLESCAKEVRQAGARSVWGLTFAREP